MKTLVLYHGTLTSNVEVILRDGLRPSGANPSHDQYLNRPSLPEFVYLASSPDGAMQHAVRISERVHPGARVSVLQVTISNRDRNIYPDEDYFHEEYDTDEWSVEKLMEFMTYYRCDWRKSLKKCRTIAYRGVIESRRIYMWDDVVGVERWLRDKFRSGEVKLKAMRKETAA